MPYNPVSKIIFIHIPKTGGTSINSVLGLNMFYSMVEVPEPQHLPAKIVKKALIPAFWRDAFKFTILREPIDKMLSEFGWRLDRNDPEIIRQFKNTEEDFHQFLLMSKDIVKQEDYTKYTYSHFRPQYQFIEDVEMDRIFHYERMDQVERHFNCTLPHYNKRKIELNDILSERNEQLIREIYAKDFDLFTLTMV